MISRNLVTILQIYEAIYRKVKIFEDYRLVGQNFENNNKIKKIKQHHDHTMQLIF